MNVYHNKYDSIFQATLNAFKFKPTIVWGGGGTIFTPQNLFKSVGKK